MSYVKKVIDEVNEKTLNNVFSELYERANKKQNVEKLLDEVVKALNRNTFNLRGQLVHRKDIDSQPYFKRVSNTVRLLALPIHLKTKYGIENPVINRITPYIGGNYHNLMTKQNYINQKKQYFYETVSYILEDYIQVFKQLEQDRRKNKR